MPPSGSTAVRASTCDPRRRAELRAAAPALEEFLRLAALHRVIPVSRQLVADTLTPVGAFSSIVGDEDGFLLESVEHGGAWSRFSFLGRGALASIVSREGTVRVEGDLPFDIPSGAGVLGALAGLLEEASAPPRGELPPLHCGLVGYLGYDVVREIERLGPPPRDDFGLPDAVMSLIGDVAAFDHWRDRVTLVANTVTAKGAATVELEAAHEAAVRRLDRLEADLSLRPSDPLLPPPEPGAALAEGEVRRVVPPRRYEQAVEAVKEQIAMGEAFQVVLSQRYDLELGCHPFDVYRVLRQVNPSPYMFFVRHGGVSIVGASPEPMVQLRERRAVIRPIAGTRRRGEDETTDRLLAASLVEDPKELAEHVMLVDLARNDIGRVVEFGSESVDELLTLERYSHVMHLTSQVSGTMVEGKGPVDLLAATLPAGTVSGAPKVRAMQIIDELEETKRGPYGGTVGYLDLSGNLDTAIAIRTMVALPDGRAVVQAGAGIVADSDPAAEDAECAAKAAAVLAAVAGARKLAAVRDVVTGDG